MTLIDKAEALLRKYRTRDLSRTVRYERGIRFGEVEATQAETGVDVGTGDLFIRSRVVDWIVDSGKLVVDGRRLSPRPGDRIRVASSGRLYEVMPLGDEPCYRVHGRDGSSLRIHSKEVAQ